MQLLQIELWKLMSDMAEQLKCEKLEEVADRVQAFSITPDTGLELPSTTWTNFCV